MDTRISAQISKAKVRIIKGNPGVGKTYLGCQIAEYELQTPIRGLRIHQKILFLTFARNAVARIRQAYLKHISNDTRLSDTEKTRKQSNFHNRVRLNTFAGFFWWLVESYGRYVPGASSYERPWLIGISKTGYEMLPEQYKGYTFSELEETANSALRVRGIRTLISQLFPLIIIDEFQDVDNDLFEIINLLSQGSRLVLLSGPGQCIYRGMKNFDPHSIISKCMDQLKPDVYELIPNDQNKQRYCLEISALISEYNNGNVSFSKSWPIKFQSIPRLTKNNLPNELETQAAKMITDMRAYLRGIYPEKKITLCVITSTNQGVAKIFDRLSKGRDTYRLRPIKATLHFDDALLLQYGRFLLELLKGNWITYDTTASNTKLIAR
ncbi:AAA family ATPase, partial [Acidobacteriota bacterium]